MVAPKRKVAYGANPPPHLEWMVGKSAAAIRAIRQIAEETGEEAAVVAKGERWKQAIAKDHQ